MTEIKSTQIIVSGTLASWRYANQDGWGLGTLSQANATTALPIVGKLVGARVGDAVELTGHWATHPKYGQQFQVRTCTAALPQTRAGVLAWLVATLPSLGPARAAELVDTYGVRLWDVIEYAPHDLAKIPGITPARAQAIYDAYQAHRDTRDSMIALRGWGLTDAQIGHCVTHWHTLAKVVDNVRANPYQLMRHVHGFGFLRADVVADKVGVHRQAPERVAAGIEHVLDLALQAGHCYVPARVLQAEACKLLGCTPAQAARGARDAVAAGAVVAVGWRYYPARIALAEARCAASVTTLLGYQLGACSYAGAGA